MRPRVSLWSSCGNEELRCAATSSQRSGREQTRLTKVCCAAVPRSEGTQCPRPGVSFSGEKGVRTLRLLYSKCWSCCFTKRPGVTEEEVTDSALESGRASKEGLKAQGVDLSLLPAAPRNLWTRKVHSLLTGHRLASRSQLVPRCAWSALTTVQLWRELAGDVRAPRRRAAQSPPEAGACAPAGYETRASALLAQTRVLGMKE